MTVKSAANYISIADALLDPKLLGSALGPTTSWSTWIALLKSAFGLTLNRAERRAFTSIAGSRKPPSQARRRAVDHRRTWLGQVTYQRCDCRLHRLLPAARLSTPVKSATCSCWLAVVTKPKWSSSYAQAFIRKSPILRQMIKNVTAYEIKLTNGVVIAVHTNSFRLITRQDAAWPASSTRSATWRDDTSANPDLEVYRAVRPSLARTGGMLIGISHALSSLRSALRQVR